jgi:hypothetical protein
MVNEIFIKQRTNFARARISLKRLNLSSNVNASQKYEINGGYVTAFPASVCAAKLINHPLICSFNKRHNAAAD